MGHARTFIRSRQADFKKKKTDRDQRRDSVKQQRRGDGGAARKVQWVSAAKPLPSAENQKLLFNQFAQACRIPGASDDLRLVLRDASVNRAAEGGDAVVQNVLALALECAQHRELFESVLTDENGNRVLCSLLRAAVKHRSQHDDLCRAILKYFEDSPVLMQHFIAAKTLGAISEHGSDVTKHAILKILQASMSTAALSGSHVDGLRKLLIDRHTSAIVMKLLESERPATVEWIGRVFGLGFKQSTTADEQPRSAKKSRKEQTASASSQQAAPLGAAGLTHLINDPVAGAVMQALVDEHTREPMAKQLVLRDLLASKRGCKFMCCLLSLEGEEDEETNETIKDAARTSAAKKAPLTTPLQTAESAAANSNLAKFFLDTLLMEPETLVDVLELSFDPTANFVVQKIIGLVPLVTIEKLKGEYHARLLHLFGARLHEMTLHPIAVHVVVSLVSATFKCGSALFSALAKVLAKQDTILELVRDKNGSLVVRKLIQCSGTNKGAAGAAAAAGLLRAIEDHLGTLMYDPTGNLIVQEVLRACGQSNAANFFHKNLRGEELFAACQHPHASHVVHCLFETLDARTHAELCAQLKPQVVELAKHLNGRFIVEQTIPAHREIRDTLLRHFFDLTLVKGTQHVLVTLVKALDAASKKNLLECVLVPKFRDLATNATGSIAVQKILQSDEDVYNRLKEALKNNVALSRTLVSDFFGKFVVQIINAKFAGGAPAK